MALVQAFDALKITTRKGKEVVKTDEQIDALCERLGLNPEGVDLYVLGWLGGCKKYTRFYRAEMEKAQAALRGGGSVSEQLGRVFAGLADRAYTDFLAVVFGWLELMLADLQKKQPVSTKVTTRISGYSLVSGRAEMIEFLPGIMDVVIQPRFKTPVFDQFVYFITNVKKRRLLRRDEFLFIPAFMAKYDTLQRVKTNTDDTTFFPILFDDFIEYIQSAGK